MFLSPSSPYTYSDGSRLLRATLAGAGICLLVAACPDAPSGNTGTTGSEGTASATTPGGSADETGETGETTSGTADPQAACTRYIECVAAVDPAGVADAVGGYGPEGTCWTPETTELCEQACVTARRDLWELFPEQSACADCESDMDCPPGDSVCDVGAGVCIDCSAVDPCVAGPCGEPGPEYSACASSLDCDGDACFEGQCGYAPLFPIARGNEWSYDVQLVGTGGPCPVNPSNYIGEGNLLLPDGEEALFFQGFCSTTFYYVMGTGDIVDVYDQFEQLAVLALREPVAEGASWEGSPGRTFTWTQEQAPVQVPAGTFDDCWTRVETGTTYSSTYCRGVGKVREVLGDVDGYIVELSSYQLH